MQNVQVTILETLQIEVPGILKSHRRDAERMCAGSVKKDIPASETRPHSLNARVFFTTGPELSLELTSFKNRLPDRFLAAARFGGIMKGPRLQFAAGQKHEIPVERTEGVLCPGWFEMRLDPSDDLRNGNPVFVLGRPRVPAKIAHRLEMNAANPLDMMESEIDDGPNLMGIDSRNQRRHQNDADLVFHTVFDRAFLILAERASSQFFVNFIFQTVKLEKNTREPGSLEAFHIKGLSRQTQNPWRVRGI